MLAASMNLRAVIEAHLRGLITDRDDTTFAHVSDCFGCDYATWKRRRGESSGERRTSEQCLKMQLGVEIERFVCDALEAAYQDEGFGVYRDYLVAWNPQTGAFNNRLGLSPTRSGPDAQNEIVGHIDLVAWCDGKPHTVIECKSASYLRGKPPTAPSQHYVEQTAAYAIAVGATQAGIIIVCRESGRIAGPFWLDLDALEAPTIARAKEVLERTNPEAEAPEPKPRYGWQPKYCGLGSKCACAALAAETPTNRIEVKS